MTIDFGRAVTGHPAAGDKQTVFRTMGKAVLGTAIAGLIAFTAPPASAEIAAGKSEAEKTAVVSETPLPSLGRHVRRAARLPFNVSLKADDEKSDAEPAKRPHLTRFVRARGHGSEATTVDGFGPDRLVESLTFPTGAPLPQPKSTALADVKEGMEPGL